MGDFEKSSQLTGSVALPTPTKSRARFPFDFDSAREGPKRPLPHPTSTPQRTTQTQHSNRRARAREVQHLIPGRIAHSTHSAAHTLTYLSHMKPCDSRSLRRVTALSWYYQPLGVESCLSTNTPTTRSSKSCWLIRATTRTSGAQARTSKPPRVSIRNKRAAGSDAHRRTHPSRLVRSLGTGLLSRRSS